MRTVRYNDHLYSRQQEVASAVDAYFGAAFGASVSRRYALNLEELGLLRLDLSHLD